MPFKWNQEAKEALDDLLIVLEEATPPPRSDNNLTITLRMAGQQVFSSTAPSEIPFVDQVSQALTSLVSAGQLDDVSAFMQVLMDHTRGEEGIEIIFQTLLRMTQFMDGFMHMHEALAQATGHSFTRPQFSIENWPPPNHPKLDNLDDTSEETNRHAESDEPARGGPQPAGDAGAGPVE